MTALVALGIILMALLGAPLFTIFGAAGLSLYYGAEIPSQAMIIEMYRMVSAPSLVAIPLFTFAGYLMAESKAPERLVNLTQALFGWMPGGLAIVCLLACAFFTAFTGASGVTIIALGGLLYPIMVKKSYPENFSLGIVTACGSLGLLFPPSLPLILYGLVASVDVDKLFLAGVIPGLVLIVLLALYGIKVGWPIAESRTPFRPHNVWKALRAAAWELPLPVIIMWGIYGGFFTADQSAAVAAFYVLIVEVFVYRDLKLTRDVPRIMQESMVLVGGIVIILAVALGFTGYLIDASVPNHIFEFIRQYISSQWMFLVALNIFLLIVGCLMDIFSATIVVVPLIVPVAKAFNVNPLHLGIVFLTNLEIGYLTPPVGLNLFISSFRFKRPIWGIVRASFPFLLILVVGLILITYVPSLSLWLVEKYTH